jgi:hypothetical protein
MGRRRFDQFILWIGKPQAKDAPGRLIHEFDNNSRWIAGMSSSATDQRPERPNDLWPVLLGALIGGLGAYGLTAVFRGFEPAVFAWLAVAAVAAVLIGLIVRPGTGQVRTMAIVAILVYAIILAYVTRDPRVVIERAEAIASGRPYCIQVADGGADYRPATSQADFTSLIMRATGSYPTFQFHAVMAVGEAGDFDYYNWSHRHQDWMALNTNGDFRSPVIRCQPRVDFASGLPLVRFTRGGETGPVWLGKRAFVVPQQYKPKLSLSTSANVIFVARAPDFEPIPECAQMRFCVFNMIEVHLRPEPVRAWLERNQRTRVQEGGFESGVATSVQCPDLQPHPDSLCAHSFLADGVLIRFSYPERQIPQWREMQEKLLALYRSFEVTTKR